MKNVMKTDVALKSGIFAIALIVMAVIPVYDQQYNMESDFQIDWDKNVKDGVIVNKYIGTRREVSIPPKIQNNPVTGIGYEAFRNNNNITSVTIPNSVTSIGQQAFEDCTSLASVTFQKADKTFGKDAFINADNTTSLQTAYTAGGMGTYTRPNTSSTTWTKQ